MKSIVTILSDTAAAPDQLTAAAAFCRQHDAHLHVFAVGIATIPTQYLGLGVPMADGGFLVEQAQARVESLATMARAWLANDGNGLRWSVDGSLVYGAGLGPTIAPATRLADLVILPQLPTVGSDAEDIMESALFDGRAPVLVVPPGGLGAAARPRSVVVAWNDTAQAAVALRAALPLLRQAAQVSVAMIAPAPHGADQPDPGRAVAELLARHGIRAETAILPRTLPRLSDVLHRHVRDRNADLLVMGAYGHSRLRESVFGGATHDMVRACAVPVLLAH